MGNRGFMGVLTRTGTAARRRAARRTAAVLVAGIGVLAGCVPDPAPTPGPTAFDNGGTCTIISAQASGTDHFQAVCPPGTHFVFTFPAGYFLAGASWNQDTLEPYNATNSTGSIVCDGGPSVAGQTDYAQELGIMTTYFSVAFPEPVQSACVVTIDLATAKPLLFQAAHVEIGPA